MRPSLEARVGIGVLLGLQLCTSLAGVALLGRMSPAVERILTENVYSTEAAEDMLAALAGGGDRAAFDDALSRARGNITEEEEVALVDTLTARGDAALQGDPAARAQVVDALRALGEVNRQSMEEADRHASRLGLAGAWTMATMGFLGFLVSLGVLERIQRRLLTPIIEVDAVLAAARTGDELRRCALPAGTEEGGRLVANLNWLLDRQGSAPAGPSEDPRLRAALVSLLDHYPRPCVLIDAAGQVMGTNGALLNLTEDGGGPAGLARRAITGELPLGWVATPLPGRHALIELLSAPGAGREGRTMHPEEPS